MKESIYIFLFGTIGVFLRYGSGKYGHILFSPYSQRFPQYFSTFPWITFTINILGSFLIGVSYAYFQNKNLLSEPLTKGILIGLLGGFTTFSSFSLETLNLWQNDLKILAFIYAFLTFFIGIGACFWGVHLIQQN